MKAFVARFGSHSLLPSPSDEKTKALIEEVTKNVGGCRIENEAV